MKRRFILILPIYILILLLGTKGEALTGTTVISETPSSTEKGNYITLKHTLDTVVDEVSMTYSYDTKSLQLVGFVPTTTSCNFESNTIKCSNVSANVTYVYPVFKITNTFSANKDISTTFIAGTETNTTKISIIKNDKIIEATNIELDSNSENLIVGATYQIVATVLPENAASKAISYTSSNEDVAIVSQTGLVTAVGAGNATITITSGNIKTVFTVTVNEAEIPLENIKIVEEMTMDVGESKAIEMTFEPENTTADVTKLTYSSSDSKVAIVDIDGKIIALASGTTTITVSLGDITTITKVTVNAVEEEKEETKEKSSSNFVACFITAIITCFVTLIVVFIRNSLKRRKELNNVNDNSDNDFKMNKYVL